MTEGGLRGRASWSRGAARGIGQGVAAMFAREGATVAGLDLRDGGETAATCGDGFRHFPCDLAPPGQIAEAFAAVDEWFGGAAPDVLVCVAGISPEVPSSTPPSRSSTRSSRSTCAPSSSVARRRRGGCALPAAAASSTSPRRRACRRGRCRPSTARPRARSPCSRNAWRSSLPRRHHGQRGRARERSRPRSRSTSSPTRACTRTSSAARRSGVSGRPRTSPWRCASWREMRAG